MAAIARLVPRPARWPALQERLRHELEKDAGLRLNEEALAVAHLYQHTTTATRARLFEFLRANGCECLDCAGQRAFVDSKRELAKAIEKCDV